MSKIIQNRMELKYLLESQEFSEIVSKAVKRELAAILKVETETKTEKRQTQTWMDTSRAWRELNLPSAAVLRRLVASGVLRVGVEVRDRSQRGSALPRFQFNIEKCQQRLSIPPEKRK